MEKETTETMKNRDESIRQEYSFAADVKLKECKYCRVMIPRQAKICPNCKMNLKSHWLLKTVAALLAIAVIGVGSYCLSVYWGLIDGPSIPGWVAQGTASVPAVSVATVSTAQADTETVIAEASDEAVTTQETKGNMTGTSSGKSDAAGTDTEVIAVTDAVSWTENEADAAGATGAERVADADKKNMDSVGKETVDTEEDELPEEGGQRTMKSSAAGTTKDTTTGDTAADDLQEDSVLTDDEDRDRESPADMDENEVAFRADCVRRSYKSLIREQEAYLGTAVMLETEVICQVDGGLFDENVYYLCMEEESSGIERYYIIRDDRETDDTLILEGDTITVYGRLFGSCKIPASLIGTRPTAPAISMLSCDLLEE